MYTEAEKIVHILADCLHSLQCGTEHKNNIAKQNITVS